MKTSSNASLSEPVYEYLRDKILNMEIVPGERIPESSIAEHFGISRTPIREALRKLANEGLLKIYPNRFAEVAVFTDSDVVNLGLVRLSLDTMAVRLAVFYGSNADFLNLKSIADQCYEAAKNGDRSSRIKLDSNFHLEICKISRNPIIEKYQSQILLQIELLQASKYTGAEEASKLTAEHFDIIDAMVARDEALAVRLIFAHLTKFYDLKTKFPFLYQ